MPWWSMACAAAMCSRWASGFSFSENGPFFRLKAMNAVPTCGTSQVSNEPPCSLMKFGASA